MYDLLMARSKSNPQITLRPQDVVVLLRLSMGRDEPMSYATLAYEVQMTASEVHASIKRAVLSQLATKNKDGKPQVLLEPLKQFLLHGLRYCFPVVRGEMTRGFPTAHAAPPLVDKFVANNDPPPVLPDKEGSVRGLTFQPLYPTVPQAAARNPAFYELLALADAVRGGSARERSIAMKELEQRIAS